MGHGIEGAQYYLGHGIEGGNVLRRLFRGYGV